MDSMIAQVKQHAGNTDKAERMRIIDELRELSYSLESPEDTLSRMSYLSLEIAACRVGIDLKIFELLAGSPNPMALDQIQEKTDAAPVLLGRLLRYLSSKAMIKEIRRDTFEATNVTQNLALPMSQARLGFFFATCGPVFQELPDFLARTCYQGSTDRQRTIYQVAWNTDDSTFAWMEKHPSHAANFNLYMASRRKDMPSWLDVYPFEQEVMDGSNDVVFVDIGGNVGHQCAELKAKYPNLHGRIILQDLPHAITMALQTPGVENMVHDAFTPQPIKGAKHYYLRAVLHDFPDDKCRQILTNITAAMGESSLILIDEMLLPDEKVHWHVTQHDLTMMAAHDGVERTKEQWAALLDSVGLEISKSYMYAPSLYESVMVVIRK